MELWTFWKVKGREEGGTSPKKVKMSKGKTALVRRRSPKKRKCHMGERADKWRVEVRSRLPQFFPESVRVCQEPMHQRAVHDAFQESDDCDLGTMFESRAHTMKTVPFFLSGAFRAAVRIFLEEIMCGWDPRNEVKQERGWQALHFFPRMLWSRPCRGGLVPRKKLETRFQRVEKPSTLTRSPKGAASSRVDDYDASQAFRLDDDSFYRKSQERETWSRARAVGQDVRTFPTNLGVCAGRNVEAAKEDGEQIEGMPFRSPVTMHADFQEIGLGKGAWRNMRGNVRCFEGWEVWGSSPVFGVTVAFPAVPGMFTRTSVWSPPW